MSSPIFSPGEKERQEVDVVIVKKVSNHLCVHMLTCPSKPPVGGSLSSTDWGHCEKRVEGVQMFAKNGGGKNAPKYLKSGRCL